MRVEAVVFDLFYTLVHPGTYPGGTGRVGWLADMLGLDRLSLEARWAAFEPELEAGRTTDEADDLGPELAWLRELGVAGRERRHAVRYRQQHATRLGLTGFTDGPGRGSDQDIVFIRCAAR